MGIRADICHKMKLHNRAGLISYCLRQSRNKKHSIVMLSGIAGRIGVFLGANCAFNRSLALHASASEWHHNMDQEHSGVLQ